MKLLVENSFSWSSLSQGEVVSKVPKSISRRASDNTVRALEVALRLAENQTIDFAIFSSQHGEISHTVKLMGSIAKQETLSPSEFSQSVHNTVSGLFTIIQKSMTPTTSIAAGSQSLPMAFVEAYTFLQANPSAKVLLVHFDEKLPEFYEKTIQEPTLDCAIGYLLKSADGENSQREYSLEDLLKLRPH